MRAKSDLTVMEIYDKNQGSLVLTLIRQTSTEIRVWIYSDIYRQTADISRTLVGNKIVDHADVVGTSPVGAAPTTSSFST